MSTNCFACEHPVSENARFCGKCTTQIRCKACAADLSAGDVVCEMCGEDVVSRGSKGTTMNQFRYRDGKKDIEIEANFTDVVGAGAANIFAMLRGGPMMPLGKMPVRAPRAIAGQADMFEPAEVVGDNDDSAEAGTSKIEAAPATAKAGTQLQDLFEKRDEQWVLVNPNLKAKSKADYVKRATCLFVQFQHDNGVKLVPRPEVVKMLQSCSVYDNNARDWFAKEKSLLRATASDLSLLLPGHQYVSEQLLPEIGDETVVNPWKVGTVRKSPRKSAAKKETPTVAPAEKASNKSDKK